MASPQEDEKKPSAPPKEEKKHAKDDLDKPAMGRSAEEKLKSATTKVRKCPYYTTIPDLSPLLYCDITPTLEKYSVADFCFICDVTGSMDPYIRAVRAQLKEFMEKVHTKLSLNPRFGFIGFRDKLDPQRIVKKDFTTDVDALQKFIDTIRCDGGDDVCEDLIVPMEEALKMDWRSDLPFVVFVLEAPTHGRSYYEEKHERTSRNFDRFPGDDKEQTLEKLCCHYRKKKINIVVFTCHPRVDRMVHIMTEYYNSDWAKIHVTSLSTGYKDIVPELGIDLCTPLAEALQTTVRRNFRRLTRVEVDSTIPISPTLTQAYKFMGQTYSGGFMKDNQPHFKSKKYDYKFAVTRSVKSEFAISAAMFGVGAYKECYLLQSVKEPKDKYVAKIPIRPVKVPEDLMPDVEGSVFAAQFETELTSIIKKPFIRVLPILIVEIPEEAQTQPIFRGSKYITAQEYLEGEYKKYNNNYGWVLDEDSKCCKLAQAFSHFTYEASLGTLIIVDIQGVEMQTNGNSAIRITDPAIHSVMYKQRFGDTNYGKFGILRFFSTHKCNEYCRELLLTDPRELKRDVLSQIQAKHANDHALKHLYGCFEKEFELYNKQLKDFNKALPPEKPKRGPQVPSGELMSVKYVAKLEEEEKS